ncbi:MAG: rane protein [Acidimicrobiales bacterium]|nr:rane protein [Acidimicrobiales bacterium]
MHHLAAGGAGFLLAVLWFDLMFDVQVRGHGDPELPVAVRDSIAAYYKRVTTDAHPMSRLVPLFMLGTLAGLVYELIQGVRPYAVGVSLILTVAAVGLAMARTVTNAVRLGAQTDTARVQSDLARQILRDHVFCAAAIAIVLVVQLALT